MGHVLTRNRGTWPAVSCGHQMCRALLPRTGQQHASDGSCALGATTDAQSIAGRMLPPSVGGVQWTIMPALPTAQASLAALPHTELNSPEPGLGDVNAGAQPVGSVELGAKPSLQ